MFKERRGLIKLSLETGAELLPTYVFGGTDFFHNLHTEDNAIARLSRRLQIGMTVFWGRWGLPCVPLTPRVTMCIADPIPVKRWEGPGPVPPEEIEALHQRYLTALRSMFDEYKGLAGYPDAVLEVQ